MDLKQIGKYEIIDKLGEGGFGAVYLATNTRLKKNVALKVLHPQVASDEMLAAYFEREALALARLEHVNIVRVYDYDQIDGVSFIVMEFVDGTNLDRILKESKALSLDKTISIFRQLLSALGFAHEHGVIHRDVKPSNIMLTKSNEVKITDFGIAKVAGSAKLTRTGTGAGSLLYMSPEQIKGKDIDNRSDLYSVGVTLYQVATGRTPFEADSDYEIMTGHLEKVPPAPTQFTSRVSRDLEQIILKSLEKKPEKRFQSAAEMSEALTRISMTPEVTVARSVGVGDQTMISSPPHLEKPSKKGLWIGIGGAAVVLTAAVLYIFSGGEKKVEQKMTFADSLQTAMTSFASKDFNKSLAILNQLSNSTSGGPAEKVQTTQYLAASKMMLGDSLSAQQLLSALYRTNPQTAFPNDKFPNAVAEYWRRLSTPVPGLQLSTVGVSLQNYEPFQPVKVICGDQSKPYSGQTVTFPDLKSGNYEIRVQGTGMKPVREIVQLTGGSVSKAYTLEKSATSTTAATGTLSVRIENYQVFEPLKVSFDGKNVDYGGAPLTFDALAPGNYEVTIITDVGRWSDQAQIDGDKKEMVFKLNNHEMSKLSIASLVEGHPEELVAAQVYIDNKKITDGETPFSDKLYNGPHKVWIEHKDYRTQGGPRFIGLSGDRDVEFVLKRK